MGTVQASDFLENLIIDHIFRTRTWAKPTLLQVALFTTPPVDAGGGTEVSGGGYARATITPADANWTATQGGSSGNSSGTAGATSNNIAVVFPAPTANWGTITHFVIYDQSTNPLIWDVLVNPRTILAGDPAPSFPIGSLIVTVS